MKYGLLLSLIIAVGLGVFFITKTQEKKGVDVSVAKDSIDKAKDAAEQLNAINQQTQEAANEGGEPAVYATPYSSPYQTPGAPYNTQYASPYQTPYGTPAPATQNISTTADEESASPASFTVPKGAKVNLTFNVRTEGVYYGGIDFRSAVVNSGTILAGQSKTVSFTADESFTFSGYWPSSGVKKNVTVKINVQ